MPQTMCWDPICTDAEVWCCSEHYLWLFGGGLYLDPFTAVYCCRAAVSEVDKTPWISGLLTWSLERESNTVSRCVRPWIKLKHRNIPLMSIVGEAVPIKSAKCNGLTVAPIESKLFSTKYMLSSQTDVTLLDLISQSPPKTILSHSLTSICSVITWKNK